ncbi:tail fiber domain-containing protein [Verrucomicrobia bacterium]|nr:tail fiber domain-containing protein [Verrucomicrobiota bacterium]
MFKKLKITIKLYLAITFVMGAEIFQVPVAVAASATPVELIAYQGFLTDASGEVLGKTQPANYDVVFRIHDSESGNASINIFWSELQTVVIDQGHFSIKLGEGSSYGTEPNPPLTDAFTDTDGAERYIGISLKTANDADFIEILPRLQILSSPYSFLASHSNTAGSIKGENGGDLLVTSGENIGIGEATPEHTLDVNGDIRASSGLLTQGELSVQSVSADGVTVTPVLQTASGHVGIGITQPAALLDVGGDTIVRGNLDTDNGGFIAQPASGEPGLTIKTGIGVTPETTLQMKLSSSEASIVPSGAQALRLGGSGGVRTSGNLSVSGSMNLTSSLTLGGGITANGGINANGNILTSTDGIYVANGYGWLRRDHSNRSTRVGGNNLGTGGLEASYDGDSNWDFYSDRRLKKDIADAEPFLERIMKTPLRRFRWKEDAQEARVPMLGVIAQEVQPLFPDLVTESENINGDSYLSVGYTSFGLISLKGVQELKQEKDREIEELKKRISKLEELISEKSK